MESNLRMASEESYDRLQEMLFTPAESASLPCKTPSGTTLVGYKRKRKEGVNVALNYRREVNSPVKEYILNKSSSSTSLKVAPRVDRRKMPIVMSTREWWLNNDRSDVSESFRGSAEVSEKMKFMIT